MADYPKTRVLLFGGFITALVVIQLAASARPGRHDRFLATFGNSWDDLARLRLQRLVTSSFIQADNGLHISILLLLIAATVAVAVRVSFRRAIIIWFLADITASVVLFSSYRVLGALGSARALELVALRDAGSSSGAHAVMTAALLTLSGRRPFIAVGALVAAQIPSIALSGNPAYVHHIIAIATTVIACETWDRRVRRAYD